jgi:hypothetical protein
VRTSPAPPRDNMIYAEDHCGLRWPLTLQAIGWPILLIATSAVFFINGNPSLSFLPTIALVGTIFAIVATVISRPVGIRITTSGISIGGVRRQHRSSGTGSLPTATAQRKQVFSCPWPAIQHVEVVTNRDRIKELARYRSDHGRLRLGPLWAPFMTAALVVQVDLTEASVPQFRPPDTQRHWLKPFRPDPYTVSATWYAPTRHPMELGQALTTLVVAPRTADKGRGGNGQRAG